MTDNILQKLEEKVMLLLTELEGLREEMGQLRQENAQFRAEKMTYTKKLQALVSLLDSLEESPADESESLNVSTLEVLQGQEEYTTA